MRHLLVAWLLSAVPALAQVATWRLLPSLGAASEQRVVYDRARARLVMVESSGQANVFRTWERIGDRWSLRATPTQPPPRVGFALAYDPARGCIVLFGGSTRVPATGPSTSQHLQDCWEYDGADWTLRSLAASPPPQWNARLVFDPANQRLLLLSGNMAGGGVQAWSYDGAQWASAPVPPFLPTAAALAADPVRNQVVALMLSSSGTGPMVTWLWNGSSWSQPGPASAPASRYSGALVFEDSLAQVVLVTGHVSTGAGFLGLTDRWGWNGSTWSLLPGPPTPQRSSASFAHDAARGLTVGVGGWAFWHPLSSTMIWDGASWSETGNRWPFGPGVACVDEVSGEIVVAEPAGAMATFDGFDWRPRPGPAGSGATALAFDRVRQRLVAVRSGAVHEWIGGAWVNLGASPFAQGDGIVFHAGRGRVVGVATAAGLFEWDGAAWTLLGPAGPGSQFAIDNRLVYDPSTDLLMRCSYFGAVLRVAAWNGAGWTVLTPPVSPPPREDYALGFDRRTQRVVLFGGHERYVQPPVVFDDLWEWTGATWQQRLVAPGPTPRAGAALVEAPWLQGLGLVLIGGEDDLWNGGHTYFGDAWALDATAGSVTTIGTGCGGPLGGPRLVASAPYPGATAFTLDLSAAATNAPALLALSWTTTSVPVGGGCTKWVDDPLFVIPTWTDAAGRATASGGVPLPLVGVSFAAQALVLDAAAPIGVALSAGLRMQIGW